MLDAVRHANRPELILELLAAAVAHESADAAALSLATGMAGELKFDRVTIGLQRGASLELTAAHGLQVSGRAAALNAAMNESIEQCVSIAAPTAHSVLGPVVMAHESLRRPGGAVATVPMAVSGKAIGAITFERDAAAGFSAEELGELERIAALVAPVLHLLHYRHRSLASHARASVASLHARLRRPGSRALKWVVGSAAAAILALVAIPVADNVAAPARIEGESQRVVVAPADGFLDSALVRAGDAVRKGQLLAELLDRDLQLERGRRQSEVNKGETAYAAAMSRSDRGAAAVHLAEVAEAQSQLDLVDQEIRRAAIVAPLDGVVIRGDLSQSIGSPVQQGDTLFMLAPAGRHRVVVEVGEQDIAGIEVGQTGELSVSALPWESLPIVVTRIAGVATTTNGRNVFEVEATLADDHAGLRPGLRGRAAIAIGRRPLGWSWFSAMAAQLRMLAWRVTP